MGTIVKRNDGYRAIVRKTGYKPQTKQFARKYDAEKWIRETESQMDRAEFVSVAKETGRELVERFRDEVAPKRPGAKWETTRLNKFLKDMPFLAKPVSSITGADVKKWRDDQLEKNKSSTVRREMVLLSGVFTHAKKEWLIPLAKNPCSLIKWPQDGDSRNRRPTDEELEALKKHFKFSIDKPPRTREGHGLDAVMWAILLGIETAMRISELCALKWPEVDLQRKFLHVAQSKNGTARDVPLTKYAIQLLSVMQTAPQNVKGGKYPGQVFGTTEGILGCYYRKACKALRINDLHFHDFRHEGITRLARIYSILDLAKIVGHKDPKNLMIYYNPSADELAARMHSPGDVIDAEIMRVARDMVMAKFKVIEPDEVKHDA